MGPNNNSTAYKQILTKLQPREIRICMFDPYTQNMYDTMQKT